MDSIKKVAVDEPLDITAPEEPAGDDLGLDGDLDLGGDLGGGGGLGGGDLGLGGDPLEDTMQGMSNEYYDALKVTKTPDLEDQINHDDEDLDFTSLIV